jgi:hypothetical protein|tara:strand:+ start:212 stop:400 length:189 start_codon:yes stop_codon:yes gene_type:complete
MKTEKAFYKSKKWWAAVIGASIPVLNRISGLELGPQELVLVTTPVVGYVLGQGVADIGKNKS